MKDFFYIKYSKSVAYIHFIKWHKRVAIYKACGQIRTYTQEVNYNMAVTCTNKLTKPRANFNLQEPTYTEEPPCNIYENIKSYKEENEQTIPGWDHVL